MVCEPETGRAGLTRAFGAGLLMEARRPSGEEAAPGVPVGACREPLSACVSGETKDNGAVDDPGTFLGESLGFGVG